MQSCSLDQWWCHACRQLWVGPWVTDTGPGLILSLLSMSQLSQCVSLMSVHIFICMNKNVAVGCVCVLRLTWGTPSSVFTHLSFFTHLRSSEWITVQLFTNVVSIILLEKLSCFLVPCSWIYISSPPTFRLSVCRRSDLFIWSVNWSKLFRK